MMEPTFKYFFLTKKVHLFIYLFSFFFLRPRPLAASPPHPPEDEQKTRVSYLCTATSLMASKESLHPPARALGLRCQPFVPSSVCLRRVLRSPMRHAAGPLTRRLLRLFSGLMRGITASHQQ